MKKYFLFLFTIVLLQSSRLLAGDTLHVLFVGNSFTSVNDLPSVTQNFAAGAGDYVVSVMAAPGGYTLQQHSTDATTTFLISQPGWDFVVLQEQSQRPAFPDDQVATDVYPYAHILDSLVHRGNPCAKTVFYMTWGYKNGDASNCAVFPPICTYDGMDSLLKLRYTIMTMDNHAVLSPVGAVRHRIRTLYPSINLYQSDEIHPTEAGTYAAAATFYAILFGKDPTLSAYDYTLSPVDAGNIRQVAKNVAYDSLANYWQYQEYLPVSASFSSTDTTFTYYFTNTSDYAAASYWDFGDGMADSSFAPTHTYTDDGDYTIRLITVGCDPTDRDTAYQNVTISGTGISTSFNDKSVRLYPNPAADFLLIKTDFIPNAIMIYDQLGELKSVTGNCRGLSNRISLDVLAPGVYNVLILGADGKRFSRAFVEQ